jgi:hypothetical protein
VLARWTGRRTALVIGINSYSDAVGPLTNPVNDATALANSLRGCGFDVKLVLNATSVELQNGCTRFADDAHGADVALVFYSGHGAQIDGANYLLPKDFNLDTDDFRTQSLNLAQFLGVVSNASNTCLAFLDACRDNPKIVKSIAARTKSIRQNSKKIEILDDNESEISVGQFQSGLAPFDMPAGDKNTLIAFATAPGRVAFDGTGTNSPFSKALIEQLGIPGLSLGSLMQRVTRSVKLATENKQVPWVNSTVEKDFYFKTIRPVMVLPFVVWGLLMLPITVVLSFFIQKIITVWYPEATPDNSWLLEPSTINSVVVAAIAAFIIARIVRLYEDRDVFAKTALILVFAAFAAISAQSKLDTWAEKGNADSLGSLNAEHVAMCNRLRGLIADTAQTSVETEFEYLDKGCDRTSSSGKETADKEDKSRKRKAEQAAGRYETAKQILAIFNSRILAPFYIPLALVMMSFVLSPLQKFWLTGVGAVAGYILAHLSLDYPNLFLQAPIQTFLSTFVLLLIIGIAYSVHTSPRNSLPKWLSMIEKTAQFRQVPKSVIVLLACSASALVGALFYPSGSYYSDTVQEFFGVQIMPAVLFAVVLALCFRWVLEMERYPAGLLAFGTVVAYIVMYPVAVDSWLIFPAVTGATGFGIILTALVVLLDTRCGTVKFWTLSLLASALAALPFEFKVAEKFLQTPDQYYSLEFLSYCQGVSLFLTWEIVWVLVLLVSAPAPHQGQALDTI